ncbi:tetratricopeptide repeat protein [Flammeovirga yaeyamensis]|uniref:Tetratricopeptide repeat protein n=1 Tax=Flammeovirga yaeyamensis TaxID=367791 RepID=A0AAX1MZU3_9BACT|nr:tetratricopeptide repeat protein [Flammeovirga yaeyamensis]MBB3700207.1 tetratricopeptide (TPR) repeat protein [Flammeovirga yaeyamensis]NMF37163.1 tetratricopeptide repeat protein [Flammeovirga yaeyamensis]QWG00854.1 tetratricopeptide repeat protein [Flammeovirga yaeyamensis]
MNLLSNTISGRGYLLIGFIILSHLTFGKVEKYPELTTVQKYFSQSKMTSDLDSSLFWLDKALTALDSDNEENDSLRAEICRYGFNISLKVGLLSKGVGYSFEALQLYEQQERWQEYLSTLNQVAIAYFKTKHYDLSLEKYQEIESFLEHHKDDKSIKYDLILGSIYNNIGVIYDHRSDNDQALSFYGKSVHHSKIAGDKKNLSNVYINMAKIYEVENDELLAEGMFLKAYELRKQLNDEYLLAKIYGHLGYFYLSTNQLDSSEDYLKKCLLLSDKLEAKEIMMNAYQYLSELEEIKGHPQIAFDYYKEFKAISDEILQNDASEELLLTAQKYKFEKREAVLLLENQKSMYLISIIALFSAVLITLFFALWMIRRGKHINDLLKAEHLALENDHLNLEKKNLEDSLEFKNKELTTNVMYLMKKNELINDVSERLIALRPSVEKKDQKKIYKIISELQSAKDSDVWEEFEAHFSSVHNEFYDVLNQKFPNLTPSEKKLCAFLRLNLTSKEICTITRKSPNSLHVARSRLRKKLGLDHSDINLHTFLENIY